MFPALRDNERALLLTYSLLVCCGTLCLLPLTAQSSMDAQAAASDTVGVPAMPQAPDGEPIARVALARDPFAPDRSFVPPAQRDVEGGDAGIVLPPNSAVVPIVRAVVLGAQSRALVDVNGEVRVLGIGDALGGGRIVEIDAGGVVLTSGARIAIVSGDAR